VKKIWVGFLISLLIHAGLYGGARAYIAYEGSHPQTIDIDLAGSSLIRRPAQAQNMPLNAVPPQPWVLSNGRFAPQPKALTFTPQAVVETEGVPCPPPCPSSPGDWLPSSAASVKPRWEVNISDVDYPKEALREGRSGRVVVVVLIDAQGVARDAQVVESSHPSIDSMVLRKIKEARFSPARDQEGNAIPVRLKLPILFELH
jgi:TonB family protein